MSSQRVLTFWISLRETFFNSIACAVINKYSKGGVAQVSTVFGPPYDVLVEGSSETALFKHLFDYVLWSP